MKTLKSIFDFFEIDHRSLIAFRSILTIGLITDLFNKLLNAKAFYSESGMLPYDVWCDLYGGKAYYWSLHFLENDTTLCIAISFQVLLAISILSDLWKEKQASFYGS